MSRVEPGLRSGSAAVAGRRARPRRGACHRAGAGGATGYRDAGLRPPAVRGGAGGVSGFARAPRMSAPHAWTLAEAARAVRTRQVSSSELVEAVLARAAAVQPKLNAFLRIDADLARAQAKVADQELAHGRDARRAARRADGAQGHVLPRRRAVVVRLEDQGRSSRGVHRRRRWRASTRPARSSSACSTWPSSPTGRPATTTTSATAAIRGIPTTSPAARRAARVRRSRRARPSPRSGRTPARRSACRRRCAASPGSRSPTAASAAPARCRCRSRSTRSARSRARAEDCALLLGVMAGHDLADATSSREAVPDYTAEIARPVRGLRVGVALNYFTDDVDPGVGAALTESIRTHRGPGLRDRPGDAARHGGDRHRRRARHRRRGGGAARRVAAPASGGLLPAGVRAAAARPRAAGDALHRRTAPARPVARRVHERGVRPRRRAARAVPADRRRRPSPRPTWAAAAAWTARWRC